MRFLSMTFILCDYSTRMTYVILSVTRQRQLSYLLRTSCGLMVQLVDLLDDAGLVT